MSSLQRPSLVPWQHERRGDGEVRGTPALLSSALPPVPEEEPPSCALASVVQHLPLELMDGVVRNLSNDDSVTDSQMLTAVSRWAEGPGLVRPLSLPEAPSGWGCWTRFSV